MKILWWLLAWCFLLVLCWPAALLALILLPVVLLLAIPFKLVGILLSGFYRLIKAIVFLPSRLLGQRC